MAEIFITIIKNSSTEQNKKRFKVDTRNNFEKILAEMGSRLGIEAKILYDTHGAEIEQTLDIRENEVVYVSQGEKFCKEESLGTHKIHEKFVRIGVLGSGSVGKSALSIRFTQKAFSSDYTPSNEDIFKKHMKIKGNELIRAEILDTSGLEELVVMRPNWIKTSEGLILVYAINNIVSFEHINKIHDQILNIRGTELPLLLVGNKSDLEGERVISKADGEAFAKKLGIDSIETSAKRNLNVSEAFEAIIKKVYEKKYGMLPEESCKFCSVL